MANDTCDYPFDVSSLFWSLNFVAYNIVGPFYFVLAVFGHSLLLFAFLKQQRSQKTYMYQVYCAGSKTVEAFFISLHCVCLHILTYGLDGIRFHSFQESLLKCYACVWYSIRLSAPVAQAFVTLSLLFSTAMAADRVHSLLRPMAYKNMSHDRNRRIAFVVCFLVSFGASAFDVPRLIVDSIDEQGRYVVGMDVEYMNQYFVTVLALLRVSIQAIALIALASLSVALCYLYRTRFVNVKAKITNTDEQRKAKEEERTLLLLTCVECSLTVISVSLLLSYYSLVYLNPALYICWQPLATPLLDSSIMILDVSNFYVIMCVSGKFRRMILRSLCCRNNGVSGASTSDKSINQIGTNPANLVVQPAV